jgi:hypothetical protein
MRCLVRPQQRWLCLPKADGLRAASAQARGRLTRNLARWFGAQIHNRRTQLPNGAHSRARAYALPGMSTRSLGRRQRPGHTAPRSEALRRRIEALLARSFVVAAYSLSLAMGLTTILTTIDFVHRNTPMCKILISKENWTSEDVCGHTADVWGQGVASSNLANPTKPIHSNRRSRTCIQPEFLPPSITSNSRSGPEADQRA